MTRGTVKSLKDILRENGYQPPPDEYVDIPEWKEPCKPKKRWLTLGDLFCSGGKLVALLGVLIQNLIAVFLWLLVILVLLQVLIGGCRG